MTNQAFISVIIPVYNAEEYIARAAESILAQNAADVELILVNDGSTDGSAGICSALGEKYEHVHVVHKENGGISSARNAGIDTSSGEYILFLDADDYLDPDACGEIGKVIRAHHPDCIDFGWKYVSKTGEITENHHKIQKNTLLGEDILREVILPPLLNLRQDPEHFVYDFACNKVFHRDLLRQHQVRFDENRRVWEDRPFVVEYLRHCRSYYSMDRCFYNYVDVAGSLSRKFSMDFLWIILENFRLYRRLFGTEYDFDTPYVNSHWCRSVEQMVFRYLQERDRGDEIRECITNTLRDAQVIHWYVNRTPENDFEGQISELVGAGAVEEALYAYERQAKLRSRRQKTQQLILRAKYLILKLLGRV